MTVHEQQGTGRATTPSGRPGTPAGDTAWREVGASRPARLAGSALLVVAFAVVAAWWTPRGPVTSTQVLVTMVASLAVGLGVGALSTTRWAALVAPVAFAAAFEVARAGAVGPSVDGIDLVSMYGAGAAVSGRGFHGLVALLPLALGASLGASLARRRLGSPTPSGATRVWTYLRRGTAIATAAVLVVAAALVARPAQTAPLLDAAGEPVRGSIAELTSARVGDHDLSMMIRGVDATNPVLLYLAGGPGGTELGAMRNHGALLEQHFVVVTLDQRGTGTSYSQIEPTATLTLESAIDDVVGVTEHLLARFGHERLYLVGQSWGTLLGALTVQREPQLYEAFVGVGQMVSPRDTDRIFYEDTLAWARATDRADVVDELTALGEPPYENLLNYATLLGHEQQVYAYDHSSNAEGQGQMVENLPAPEYGLVDTMNVARGLVDSFALVYPQLQQVDLRASLTRLDVPVYLAQGRHEARGRMAPAREWFDALEAPEKRWVEFDTSGHRPIFEQPTQFAELMVDTVLSPTGTTS